jgi:hypothetical protein
MAAKKPAAPATSKFVAPAYGPEVGVLCVCVPEGVVPGLNGERIRLSLSLLPEHAQARSGYGATLRLQEWPGYFSWQDFGFALYIIDETTKRSTRIGSAVFRDHATDHHTRQALKLWRDIFTSRELVPNDNAFEAFNKALVPEKRTVTAVNGTAVTAAGQGVGFVTIGTRRYNLSEAVGYMGYELARVFRDRSTEELMHALVLRLAAEVARDTAPAQFFAENNAEARNATLELLARAARPMDPRTKLSYATDGWSDLVSLSPPGDAFGLLDKIVDQRSDDRRGARRERNRRILNRIANRLYDPSMDQLMPNTGIWSAEELKGLEDFLLENQLDGFVDRVGRGESSYARDQSGRKQSSQDQEKFLKLVHELVLDLDAAWSGGKAIGAKRNIDKKTDRWSDPFNPENVARRKLSAIKAHPTLAKFVRLIIDLEVPTDLITSAIGDAGNVSLMAVFGKESDVSNLPNMLPDTWKVPRTRFHLKPNKERTEFTTVHAQGTAARGPGEAEAYPLHKEVVQLRSANAPQRFVLDSTDPVAATYAAQVQGEAAQSQQRSGAWPDEQVAKSPELRTRGIALLDRASMTQSLAQAIAKPLQAQLQANTLKPPLYTEDLIIGYRLDVRRTRLWPKLPPNDPKWRPWRTLMAREVIFKDIHAAFGKSIPDILNQPVEHPYGGRFRERDDGIIRAWQKVDQLDDSEFTSLHSQIVATWSGGSLALSARREPVRGESADHGKKFSYLAQRDLGIDVEYRFASQEARFPHVLRTGDGYECGMRYVLANGISIGLEKAERLFDETAIGDPAAPKQPLVFRRTEEVAAPDICVAADELALATPGKSPTEGDQADVVILTEKGRESASRFLIPPGATFDYAEQYRLFDYSQEEVPAGVLRNFAIGELVPPAGPKKPPKQLPVRPDLKPRQPTRPAALSLKYQADAHKKRPYYPDPLARNIGLAFIRNGHVPESFEELSPQLFFWEAPSTKPKNPADAAKIAAVAPLEAIPVELIIRRWPDGIGGRFGEPKMAHFPATQEKIRQIAIDIAPAEEADLIIWTYPDPAPAVGMQALLAQSFKLLSQALTKSRGILLEKSLLGTKLREQSKAIAELVSTHELTDSPIDPAIWRVLLGTVPLMGISMWRELKVVYAVEKPLLAPAFRRKEDKPNGARQLNIIRLTNPTDANWQKKLDDVFTNRRDLMQEPSEPAGTTGYFAGSIAFDRASTGALRCEAAWSNAGEQDSVVWDKDTRKWKQNLRYPVQTLFELPGIPRDRGENPHGTLDLVNDEFGKLRSLSWKFNDTRARKLSLRLVATSRFTDYFKKVSKRAEEKKCPMSAGQFEAESCPDLKCVRDTKIACEEFWLKATERPGIPKVEKVVWVHPEEIIRHDRERIIVQKRVVLRIYLDRWWHNSGDEELLGIICWPPNLVENRVQASDPAIPAPHRLDGREATQADDLRRMTLCDFEACSSFAARYATRWGTDSTTISANLDSMIGPDRFAGYVRKAANLIMPRPDKEERPGPEDQPQPLPSPAGASDVEVAVIGYAPRLDPDEGLWYCDVDFDPGPAYAPFVRFGLVRYQPHAEARKELSQPLPLDPIQIPPPRTVDIHIESMRRIVAEVSGQGYRKRSLDFGDYPQGADGLRNLTDVPLQKFSIKRTAGAKPGLVKAYDHRGKPVEYQFVQPIESEAGLRWICSFDLPESIQTGEYSLVVEEADLFTSDADTRPSEPDPIIGTLVDVPGKFACSVDLWREPKP